MKSAVKKTATGAAPTVFFWSSQHPKARKRHYPAAASHCHAISLCPVIPYCHGLGIIPVSYPRIFVPPFSAHLRSPLVKRGEMWYNIPTVGAGFPVTGCYYTQARCGVTALQRPAVFYFTVNLLSSTRIPIFCNSVLPAPPQAFCVTGHFKLLFFVCDFVKNKNRAGQRSAAPTRYIPMQ